MSIGVKKGIQNIILLVLSYASDTWMLNVAEQSQIPGEMRYTRGKYGIKMAWRKE